jgi:ActR/RegA family two-component response regulator
VISDNEILNGYLRRNEKSAPFNLEITDGEYSCSALVEHFRPDYAVIDCSLGQERAPDIGNHLVEDPRIPHVRIIMAVEPGEHPTTCNKNVFAYIEKPFGVADIVECLNKANEGTG